jgi:prophage regulatory protein
MREMARAGKFPKPVRISERCVAWIASEVESWLADRIAASRNAAA